MLSLLLLLSLSLFYVVCELKRTQTNYYKTTQGSFQLLQFWLKLKSFNVKNHRYHYHHYYSARFSTQARIWRFHKCYTILWIFPSWGRHSSCPRTIIQDDRPLAESLIVLHAIFESENAVDKSLKAFPRLNRRFAGKWKINYVVLSNTCINKHFALKIYIGYDMYATRMLLTF